MPPTAKKVIKGTIAVLEKDAKYLDRMAKNLRALIPRLVGEQQKALMRSQVRYRRVAAKQLRALIKRMKGR